MNQPKICTVIINWNGEEDSLACIKSLKSQTINHTIVAVDNASSEDNFSENLPKLYPEVVLLQNSKNLGFAGGCNTAFRWALKNGFDFIALLNNDAVAEQNWLEALLKETEDEHVGIVSGKLLKTDGTIDSTGDFYTTWGLPFPRGRDEPDTGQYNASSFVFGATGGACLLRAEVLSKVGLYDEDFFMYYEDVDLSFRAQLAGWRVRYSPKAVAHHKLNASSNKVSGLATYMSVKNLPFLYWKNMPLGLIPKTFLRFNMVYSAIMISAIKQRKFKPLLQGLFFLLILTPKKFAQRLIIQSRRQATSAYIDDIIVDDLPPNAKNLRKISRYLRLHDQ